MLRSRRLNRCHTPTSLFKGYRNIPKTSARINIFPFSMAFNTALLRGLDRVIHPASKSNRERIGKKK
ncbi:unnamed protein product [Rodentolepis nana]|uniref:Uncharacterized protein n=1 Tax=Rodentolepis nana TaxID=102285 RepID=A0A0R3TRB3_RODNA|nr:unnamed protein product [Rodentolepis nana]